MGGHVIDFSWARPDPQAVRDAGFDGVIGYVGHDHTGKLLQKEWFDAYVAVGLDVGLVWELGAQRALAGYDAGRHDAADAAVQADNLGYTGVVYFVLEDPTKLPQSDWPAVVDYAQGVADAGAHTGLKAGGYGSKALLNHVKDLGLITRMWYVGPWGHDWDGADLVQTYRDDVPPIVGTPDNQYDEDYHENADWGQHPRPGEDDEDMTPELKKALDDLESRMTLRTTQLYNELQDVKKSLGRSDKQPDGTYEDDGIAGAVHEARVEIKQHCGS